MTDPTAPQPDDERPAETPEHDSTVPALEDDPTADESQPGHGHNLAQDDELGSGHVPGVSYD